MIVLALTPHNKIDVAEKSTRESVIADGEHRVGHMGSVSCEVRSQSFSRVPLFDDGGKQRGVIHG